MASHLTLEDFGLCKVSRSCGCKTNLNPQSSTTVLDSWQVFELICSFWLLPNVSLCVIANISTLISHVQRTLFQKSCGFFPAVTLQTQAVQPHTFYSFSLTVLTAHLSSSRCTSSVFAISLKIAHSDLGVNLWFCLECFPLVNNPSYCWMMHFKQFENDLISHPRVMSSNNCVFA